MDQTVFSVRRCLNRVGWALLLYFLTGQLLGVVITFIPGVQENYVLYLLLYYVAIYLLAPLALWLVLRPLPRGRCAGMSLSPRAFGRTALYCLGVGYGFNLLTNLLLILLSTLTENGSMNPLMTQMEEMPLWLTILLMSVAAPVFEELIFRKLLLDRLRPLGSRCAIWISAAAFGLFHMNLYQLFYAVALGVVLAGTVVKTGKIWHSIALHAIINSIAVVTSQLYPLAESDQPVIAAIGNAASLCFGILVLFCIVQAVRFHRRYAPSYRHLPPRYALSAREILLCLPRCPGIWVCVILCLALSVFTVFAA